MSQPFCTIITGDALSLLRGMESECVQMCVTSPPYHGLRDYGCPGQIGLEDSLEDHIAVLVEVFREVRRVLKKDGVLYVNYGDSYHGSGRSGGDPGNGTLSHRGKTNSKPTRIPCLKPKDLIGMPWMLAFALRADGWYLRQEIIWNKSNPMPESVRDRCTKSHEHLFLLSKNERYYFDSKAIREPVTGNAHSRGDGVNPKCYKVPAGWDTSLGEHHGTIHKGTIYPGNGVGFGHGSDKEKRGRGRVKTPGKNSRENIDRDPAHLSPKRPRQNDSFSAAISGPLVDDRNKRSVWTIATAPYRGAHFATFPPDLVKPCILSGSRAGDVCLDPFAGSGTTGAVALELGRSAVLLELNPAYAEMARHRTNITPGLRL